MSNVLDDIDSLSYYTPAEKLQIKREILFNTYNNLRIGETLEELLTTQISGCFCWDATPEGAEYWQNLHLEILKEIGQS